jgi:hypothetical protein
MPEDKSVKGFIQSMSTAKTAIEVDVIKQTLELAQSKPRDSTSEIIDLVFAVTGYDKADVPGGESHIAGECIAKLVRYLTLRAKATSGDKSNESFLPDTILELIVESVHLYGEMQANSGVKVVTRAPTTAQGNQPF